MKEKNNLLIFILTIGVFGIINTEMGVLGILPLLAEKFSISIAQAGLLVSLFALAVAAAGPVMPLLFAGIDRKRVMLLVLSVFVLGNLISVFTDNFAVTKHQGKILTKQQIYEEVWGEEYFYDDSNIMAIISRLRKKLEVNPSSPKYIQTVKGIGYRFNKEV